MQKDSIKKAIDLVKKTGDKMIVLDKEDSAYVLMSIEDYEELILSRSEVAGLTEEELLDKINREIAIWKSNREGEVVDDIEDFEGYEEEFDEEDDYYDDDDDDFEFDDEFETKMNFDEDEEGEKFKIDSVQVQDGYYVEPL